MLKRTTLILSAAALSVGSGALAHPAPSMTSMKQARGIALHAAPGQVVASKFDKREGRYVFDIRQQRGAVHQVGVDRKTGKVVENVMHAKAHRR